ncbi:hypothetical protein Nepgr_019099 [Nepenthes gracilis]|uniref:DUF4378 domain-containing protein n=1 Tax=Nepenthes gracilis TaxID=150966 RepID=A0AAD3STE7_NEPGR|nr:hypothetical protein Nepgr_019099 [Nepenthes gracilis]
MAKKSRQRQPRYEKNESGCIRGLISIFDFLHIRSTRKLLPERKHGTDGMIGDTRIPDMLNESWEPCEDINGGEQSETATADAGKTSVKELMEEEMISEQDQKTQMTSEADPKRIGLASHGGHARRNRKQVSSKSFDIGDADLGAADSSVSGKHAHRKFKSASSLDLSVMMEELYSQIHQKNTHNPNVELMTQSDHDSSAIERKLGEAMKVFVNHFADQKCFTKHGKIQPSKELFDALHILNSNKEVFLKLHKDPNSQLVKYMQILQDSHIEIDGNSRECLEHDPGNGKQQESFFWRKFKVVERTLSNKNENAQDLNRIVVLKPGPLGWQNAEAAVTSSSWLQSPQKRGNFSFTELKRRLKYAMRKERSNSSNTDNEVAGENGRMSSPSRDHFFIERIPKPSAIIKRERRTNMECNSSFTSERGVSNIYIEAKKHLAEIVSSSDIEADFLSKGVPKSLGRVLSFPEYSSPISSPRKDGDVDFDTSETRLSPHNVRRAAAVNACCRVQQINARDTGLVKQSREGNSCIAGDILDVGVAAPVSGLDGSDEISSDDGMSKTSVSVGDNVNSEVDAEVTRLSDSSLQNKSNDLDISISGDDQLDEELHNFLGICQPSSLELVPKEENEPSSSPVASPPDHLCTEGVEDLEGEIDQAGKPSPISVTEPIFEEDDIFPRDINFSPAVAELIQPQRLVFEEQTCLPPDSVAHIRTWLAEKKVIFNFVKVVVQKSGLTWGELLQRSLLSDHILEPSLFDEVEFINDQLCDDPSLLFDLINEVLSEVGWHNFGCMLSFSKLLVVPELKGKCVAAEAWEGVDWYLQLQGPRTLDQILENDYSNSRLWMDLRGDREIVGIEMEEAILEELIEEIIMNCANEIRECGFSDLGDDSKHCESKIEL